MLWVDGDARPRPPPREQQAFWAAVVEARPQDGRALARLGLSSAALQDWLPAADALERAHAAAPERFAAFDALAAAQLALARPDDVLATIAGAERAERLSWIGELSRARAHHRRGEIAEACASALRAVRMSSEAHEEAEQLLSWMCARRDGGALLAACETLPEAHQGRPAERGYRAIALDLLGRHDEAGELIDLPAGLAQATFAPPGDEACFNDALAAEVERHAVEDGPAHDRQSSLKNTALDAAGAHAFPVLATWVRARLEAHCALMSAKAPAAGYLLARGFIYRRGGHNGVHMHSAAHVAGVYHVRMPSDLAGDAGILMLGLAPPEMGDYKPSWRVVRVAPQPGTLTLFPAHVFHDFRPTGSERPRVAIGIDLRAAANDERPSL